MQFTLAAAVLALAGFAAASPTYKSVGACAVGEPQCCAKRHSGDDASKLASLLGLEDVVGDIAVSCDQIPINIIGVAAAVQNQCKSAPVCCDQTSQDGLVQLGCTNAPLQ
ncbi:hypothetical protein FA09DRAFT_327063 [Tilletiopsis washingtonensis]|uniref:Hydrophobin n=1 Tax=Tilletiopsis washingtonensis TaxID=58919 RepID=A0A316ZHW9_9BASI|nr:hypothetical protein FA09DRAFT_327063 [Tilletiopsis washingtonensis]PWO01100.1 hypothetical protein FA09DRAFT_327063 [Tilletiopsis washingtonensis]